MRVAGRGRSGRKPAAQSCGPSAGRRDRACRRGGRGAHVPGAAVGGSQIAEHAESTHGIVHWRRTGWSLVCGAFLLAGARWRLWCRALLFAGARWRLWCRALLFAGARCRLWCGALLFAGARWRLWCRALLVAGGRWRLVCGALLLVAAALAAQQQPAAERPATVTVLASSAVAKLSGDRLAASVAWLLGEWYGPAVAARAATGDAAPAAAQLLLSLTATDRGLHLRSELVERGRSLGVRSSWLPAGSLGAVTATAAGDGFLLWSQARRFPHLRDLGTAPVRGALLPAAGLARLLQRPVAGHDVQAAAAYAGGVLVLLADGPVALGHRFDIVPDTAVWLTWRDGPPAAAAPWRNLYPLQDGRVVLQPWSGDPVVVAPEQAPRSPPGATDLFAGPVQDAAPTGTLLAVAPDGTAAWHESGEVIMRGYGAAEAGAVRLPLGSLAPSATTADSGGALWAFDPREHRLRAFAATGGGGVRQILAVTPLLPAQELAGVQALAITAGGQFLIGSQRAVWSVDRRGIPRWALRLLHTQPRQRLPQAFTLTAGGERGAFLLLDRSTGSVHRFTEQPEPAAARHLTSAAAPKPGALAAALTDSAVHAAERAWQRRQPQAAALLLSAAGRHLKHWHAADPLAAGVEQRSAAIEQLSETVEHALYGEPPLAPRIAPGRYHPALGAYYETHPFELTIRNTGRDRAPAAIELGIAGATAATTVAAPAMAAGAQATVPVQLYAAPGSGSTGVAHETTLWLSAAASADAAPVLSALPLAVTPERCLPEQAAAAPAGAHAAFLRWHLTAAANSPALPAPPGLSPYRLVDRVARLADVVAGGRCLQTAANTLATLAGSATDWALAVAGVLHRRGTPVALLVADAPVGEAAPVLVLAWFEHRGEAVDAAAPSLAPAALQQLTAHLEDAAQSVPPGRVWALQPDAATADTGSGGEGRWHGAWRAPSRPPRCYRRTARAPASSPSPVARTASVRLRQAGPMRPRHRRYCRSATSATGTGNLPPGAGRLAWHPPRSLTI